MIALLLALLTAGNAGRRRAKLAITLAILDAFVLLIALTCVRAVWAENATSAIVVIGLVWTLATSSTIWFLGGVVVDSVVIAGLFGWKPGQIFNRALYIFIATLVLVTAFLSIVPIEIWWTGYFLFLLVVVGLTILRRLGTRILFSLVGLVIAIMFCVRFFIPEWNFNSAVAPARGMIVRLHNAWTNQATTQKGRGILFVETDANLTLAELKDDAVLYNIADSGTIKALVVDGKPKLPKGMKLACLNPWPQIVVAGLEPVVPVALPKFGEYVVSDITGFVAARLLDFQGPYGKPPESSTTAPSATPAPSIARLEYTLKPNDTLLTGVELETGDRLTLVGGVTSPAVLYGQAGKQLFTFRQPGDEVAISTNGYLNLRAGESLTASLELTPYRGHVIHTQENPLFLLGMRVINYGQAPMNVYLVQPDGTEKQYSPIGGVGPGLVLNQPSFAGNVWKVTSAGALQPLIIDHPKDGAIAFN
ncbi:hypothetical protein D4S03_11105 [bacterium]|nr:MAG: hypothetical protein D4S03_11105 [bacterium]